MNKQLIEQIKKHPRVLTQRPAEVKNNIDAYFKFRDEVLLKHLSENELYQRRMRDKQCSC